MLTLARSFWRKALVTVAAAAAIVWLYETTIPDSKHSPLPLGWDDGVDPTAPPTAGSRQLFSATAYCKGFVTSSGVAVQAGAVAADPVLLPAGSIIEIDVGDAAHNGIYTVLDTGPEIRGRDVDIYMWSCHDALRFGRRPARITVLRLGWDPRATTPSLINRLFTRPSTARRPLPARPLPTSPPRGPDVPDQAPIVEP